MSDSQSYRAGRSERVPGLEFATEQEAVLGTEIGLRYPHMNYRNNKLQAIQDIQRDRYGDAVLVVRAALEPAAVEPTETTPVVVVQRARSITASIRDAIAPLSHAPTKFEFLKAENQAVVILVAKLAQAVNSSGLTQTLIAERLGVTPPRVSQLLSGGNPTVRLLARVAEALGYTLRIDLVGPADRTRLGYPPKPRGRGDKAGMGGIAPLSRWFDSSTATNQVLKCRLSSPTTLSQKVHTRRRHFVRWNAK